MPAANPFDQFDAPSGPASGLDTGNPVTGYLGSTYGADVAGAAQRLGKDVTQQPAARAQGISDALTRFQKTGDPMDALALAKEAAGIYVDAYHLAADAANVPMTAIVGAPLHTAVVRPLAEGEHALLSAMPTNQRAARLSDKERRRRIVAERGLGALLPGGQDVTPEQDKDFGQVPSVEDLEKDIWNDLYLAGPKGEPVMGPPQAREPLTGRLPVREPPTPADTARTGAARRLIGQGKLDSRQARQAAQEHRDVDAGDPRLLDVMETPAQRVVRTAATRAGDADTILEEHRRRARADVGARATQRTEALSTKQGSAEQRVAALKTERDTLASSKYREPYSHPIETEPSLFEALDSPEAARAIRTAKATARERMIGDPQAAQQYHELGALDQYFADKAKYEVAAADHARQVDSINKDPRLAGSTAGPARQQAVNALNKQHPIPPEPKPPIISGGALDRVRIHMRDRASQLADSGNNARASGIRSRMDAIDEHLDKAPHLQEARASYRDYSTRIRQAEFDKDVSTMRPEQFKAMLKDLTPEQRAEFQHAVVERLSSRFGTSSRGAQGLEDVLTTGYNAKANLTELLGKEVADRYLRAVDLIGQSVDKANFVGSRTGSQTRMIDQDVKDTATRTFLDVISGRYHQAVVQGMRFLARHHFGMGEDEARQIAEWAVQQKDVEATLHEIADAAEKGNVPKGLPPELKAIWPASVAAGKGAQSGPAADDADKGPKEANPFDQFDSQKGGDTPSQPAAQAAPAPTPVPTQYAAFVTAPLTGEFENNNPTNLQPREDGKSYVGQTGVNGRFAVFDTPEHGLQASVENLHAYYTKHGIDTLYGITDRWAPAGDGSNDPKAYAETIGKTLGIDPSAHLNMDDRQLLRRIALAQIGVEGTAGKTAPMRGPSEREARAPDEAPAGDASSALSEMADLENK